MWFPSSAYGCCCCSCPFYVRLRTPVRPSSTLAAMGRLLPRCYLYIRHTFPSPASTRDLEIEKDTDELLIALVWVFYNLFLFRANSIYLSRVFPILTRSEYLL